MTALRRIKKELDDMTKDPPPTFTAEPVESDQMFHWVAKVNGPSGTVYSGGIFKLFIVFPNDYPFDPPKLHFATPIYHCNIRYWLITPCNVNKTLVETDVFASTF